MKKSILSLLFILSFSFVAICQNEILNNQDIILMSQSGLSKDLIIRKIQNTKGSYQTTAEHLIELKKEGVADDLIELMMDKVKNSVETAVKNEPEDENYSDSDDADTIKISFDSDDNSRIVLDPKEALQKAKTIAIEKSSLHPSRQALEKELLKRSDWQSLDLNLVRLKDDADLYIEIGYVSMSWITHRYVYRVYDRRSGTVIIAGETTSWGSLAENLARGISKRLRKAMNEAGK